MARRMQPDAQGGHDAEIAATAVQRPEEVGLRVGTGCHAPPVRQHDFGAEQVVRHQAAGTAEGPVTAPQGQAGHADRAAITQGRDQAASPGGDEELQSQYLAENRLDLSAWARDAIALELPDKILCRPECAGLCAVCGKNLNDEPHDHGEPEPDSRWSALAELKEKL